MKLNKKGIALFAAGVILIGALAFFLFDSSPEADQSYTLSRTHTAPFKRLTIQGEVSGGISSIIVSEPNVSSPEPITSYRWESADRRFLLIDPNILKQNDETFTYKIEMDDKGEVIPGTDSRVDSIVTLEPFKKPIGINVSVEYFMPDIYNFSAKYTFFELKGIKVYGIGGYNSRTKTRVGVGVEIEW